MQIGGRQTWPGPPGGQCNFSHATSNFTTLPVLSSRYGTTISKMSANINPDQVALLSAAIMMLYYACLAAYDDT
ncbi:hypothetical protein L211DRAFT_833969 [Terfezia boudieri ATCC MYA-4762]|uniref:Uncharacterized protein n=1 Tax=Terfezia boudieri ATCC MYA-4762 TaxID=1051890 RepID=A0A3N4LYK4_9PEZI|nr:hypothetical protein L211DRAFT_833969 [Terfezia boudieri ATCC MYA-4762]